jgi:hypothetical protein
LRPPGVVPLDPLSDRIFGLHEVLKPMLLDALLLQAAEEMLDDPVMFDRVRANELLPYAVVLT